jgi:glycosyltransferase involved in cell wall biosynthesis
VKILILADGRSATTRSWIRALARYDDEIHLITTYPCDPVPELKSQVFLPLAFSHVGREGTKPLTTYNGKDMISKQKPMLGRIISRFRKLFLSLRYILGPVSLIFTQNQYLAILKKVQPDLVHALRIPFEGMLAAYTPKSFPVIVSTWGNDFTLHANKSIMMKNATRRAVKRVDGFLADCQRDIRLAKEWGLQDGIPAMFAPGSGGLDMELIRQKLASGIPNESAVINPRGIRPVYVHNDQFFQSLPEVLWRYPRLPVYCAAMRDELDAVKWIRALDLPENVQLLPAKPQDELWDYFLRSRVVVSPAIHDGTPNSVLESMALGCIPVAGDIETLREWIVDGENGLLVDPSDPAAIAKGILHALEDDELYARAKRINFQIIQEKADRDIVMPGVRFFYMKIIESKRTKRI